MKLSKEERRRLRKEKKSGFFAEFKKFITRGNIVDMSVGVIVGGAFTAIVNGLSNNILKPVINWFLAKVLGKNSLSEVYTYLQKVEVPELDAEGNATGNMIVDLTQSIHLLIVVELQDVFDHIHSQHQDQYYKFYFPHQRLAIQPH